MPTFEKFRDSNALAEISRKLRTGENKYSLVETTPREIIQDDLPSHHCQVGSRASSEEEENPSSSSQSLTTSSSACTTQGEDPIRKNEREDPVSGKEDGQRYQEMYQEFLDDDVMTMLQTSAENEKNDISVCLYAIEYILSRS